MRCPGGVDHRADGVQERRPSLAIVERGVPPQALGDVGAGLKSDLAQGPAERLSRAKQSLVRDQGEDDLGSRQAGCAQDGMNVAGDPAA